MNDVGEIMRQKRIAVVVPSYNNAKTVVEVLQELLTYTHDIILVDDGCTDGTLDLIEDAKLDIDVVSLKPNQGKGKALLAGFDMAREKGFEYAVTIDSDRQHYPSDLPKLVEACQENTLVVGQRGFDHENMPSGNTFANKFSNFWFTLQTGIKLDDTQTGYRIYPLDKLRWKKLITSRYEAELEMMVFAAWHGVDIVKVPIRVYYPPEGERVSHFRPYKDFGRISLLNTALCFGAGFYGWPMILYRKFKKACKK
jgi:glycosyltransferase involved in cell wall biosynthesis